MGYIITAEKDTDLCRKGCKFAVEGQGVADNRFYGHTYPAFGHNIHYAKWRYYWGLVRLWLGSKFGKPSGPSMEASWAAHS